MVESAPTAVDLQEFQFKLHSKLKIFNFADDSQFKASTNLIAAASKYGLIFVGSPSSSLEVVQSKTIEASSTGKVEATNFAKRSIPLSSAPSHLALNCDQSLLAVVVSKDGCATAIIYSVPSFLSQNVAIVREVRVSVTSGVSVLETCWNPAMPTVFTACKSDGSLGVYNIQENSVDINEIPSMARATSFCWSPKGKQIVVGSVNGTLTQYKPDLKAVKAIAAPSLQGAGPFSVVNVFWLTNYQFVAVYNDIGNSDARAVTLIVNAPKVGAVIYINYDDICYSNGTLRSPQFYIIHQPTWGVLLVASANSMEVGVLGVIQTGEPAVWQQWNQIDAARAELPLSANHEETFPVGFAFDTGITMQLPWGENQLLPAMPMIHILSHHGVLCSFAVINIRQGVATLCTAPVQVPDQSGLGQFRIQQQATPTTASVSASIPVTKAEIAVPQAISFGLSVGVSPNSSTFAKPTAQPATPFSGSATPSLFGTTPNFSAPAVPASSATPACSASMFSSLSTATPSFGTVSGALNYSMTSNASAVSTVSTSTTSVFSGSSIFSGTSVADGTSNKISMPPLSTTTAPNFQSMNLSTKPVPQNVSTSLNTSIALTASVAPKSQAAFAVKPIIQPLLATPKDQQPQSIIPKQPSKPDILTNTQQSSSTSDLSSARKDDATTALNSHAIQCQIRDDIRNFHAELQELFHRCRNINLNVGTDEEKSSLVLTTNSLMEFYKELQETTDSLTADVHYLKQAVMQSFAWYEDTKSRQRRYTEPNYANLTQELDPFSEKQLTYIKHLIYDIELQLKQVDGFLDNQWAEFQDSCKKRAKEQMQLPILEPIYQSLVRQNAILDKQRYVLKDIASRIKTRNRKAASYPSVMNVNLTKCNKTDNQIDEEFNKLHINDKDIYACKYERIIAEGRKFTQVKQSELCEFFTNRSVVHIAPKKPKWLSSPVLRAPSSVTAVSFYVQRSLNQTFDQIAPQVNNVGTNVSSSNLFNSSLIESSQTKLQQPTSLIESSSQIKLQQPTEKTYVQQKTAASFSLSNLPKTVSMTSSMKYTAPASTSAPVFSFTAATSNVTQAKPQYFTSNTQSSIPNFSLGSNITITAVAANAEKDKTNQPKSNSLFNFSSSANTAPIATNPQKTDSFSFSSANTAATATQNKPDSFGFPSENTAATMPQNKPDSCSFSSSANTGATTPHNKPDSFSFSSANTATATQNKPDSFSFSSANTAATTDLTSTKVAEAKKETSKPTLAQAEAVLIKPNVVKTTTSTTESTFFGGIPTPDVKSSQPFTFTVPQAKSITANIVQGRDSLDTSSAAFSFGKALSLGQQSTPKPKGSTALMFGQGTAVTVASQTLDATGSSAANTQKAAPKPAFSIPQTTVPVSSKSFDSPVTTAVVSSALVISKVETIPTTTTLFGNVSTSSPTTANPPSLFKQPLSTPSTATTNSVSTATPSLFAGASVTTPFGQQVASTVSTPISTPSSLGSIFATPAASTASIFANNQTTSTPGSLFAGKTTTAQSTTSLFAQKTESSSTTSAASSGFSFVQSAEPKTTSIFGGAAQTTSPGTGFASTTTTTTGFSFLQPTITTSATTTIQQVAPKATILGETKPTETVTAPADTAKGSQESTFGFDSLAVSSADSNKFSFGNLTVSALSPNANTTTSTAATGTFSFAQPATTTTTSLGGFGLFGKPATTTTASSFMGQPICSPSTFSQNTGSVFGQSTGNIFAQKSNTPSATGGSIFGQSSGSLFGGTGASTTASTASTASIFGQTASTPFGSSAPSKTGSIFGQSSDFPATTTTASSIFGQNTFGSPAATSAASSFSFNQQTGGANTGFGASSGSIFGAKPTFGQAPAFGQTATFGSPSAFGSTPAAGSVFGSPATPTPNTGAFGSGFSSPSGAYGQKPAFGSPPSFGQSSFGAPPAFGSSPAFGSPQGMFGQGTASPPGGTFGSAVQENSTFANLANQSTLGFGNLAQNQPDATPSQASQFSGGSQFSSWR